MNEEENTGLLVRLDARKWKVTDPLQLVRLFMWMFLALFALIGAFYLVGLKNGMPEKDFWEYVSYATPSTAAIVAGGTFYLSGNRDKTEPRKPEYGYYLAAACLLLLGLGAFIGSHWNPGPILFFSGLFVVLSLFAFSGILIHEHSVFVATKHPRWLWSSTIILIVMTIAMAFQWLK